MNRRTEERVKRGPNYPQVMKDSASRLFVSGSKPPSIAKELEKLFPDAERWPDERTVRDWTKAWSPDQSGPWAFSEVGDPAVLLPVLQALIEETQGMVTSLSTAEADVLTRLGRAVSNMPAFGMYNWARATIAARSGKEPVDSLIHYLAFRPWEDNGQRYLAAADRGWIKEVRSFCPGDGPWLPLGSRRAVRSMTLDAVIVRARG